MMRAEMGKEPSRAPPSQLNLPPGFRFYPTDEELVVHYLCKKAACEPFAVPIIAEVELYKYDPWDLPERALFGEKEWYFFSPRDRKYPNGSRPNRAAGTGYWKATGTDKPINSGGSKKVGVKKALVFYKGKAPKGVKTNWIMHEYRLADSAARSAKRKGSLRLDDWVLCRIYKKCSSAQKAAAAAAADEAEAATHNSKDRSDQEDSSIDDDTLESLPEITATPDNSMNNITNATPNNNNNFAFMQGYIPNYGNPMDVSKYGMMDGQFSSLPQMATPPKYATYTTPSVNTTSSDEFSYRDSPPESSSIEESHGPLRGHQHLNLGALDNNSLLSGLPSPSALLPPGAFSNDLDFLYNSSDYIFNFQPQHRSFSSYLDNRISHF